MTCARFGQKAASQIAGLFLRVEALMFRFYFETKFFSNLELGTRKFEMRLE